jgi:hypothetical protein
LRPRSTSPAAPRQLRNQTPPHPRPAPSRGHLHRRILPPLRSSHSTSPRSVASSALRSGFPISSPPPLHP